MKRKIIITMLLIGLAITHGVAAQFISNRNKLPDVSYTECQQKINEIYKENEPLREFQRHINTSTECQTFFINALTEQSFPGKDYRRECEEFLPVFCNRIQQSSSTTLIGNFKQSPGFQTQQTTAMVLGAGTVMAAQKAFERKEKITQGTTYMGAEKECVKQIPRDNIASWSWDNTKRECKIKDCDTGFYTSDQAPGKCISQDHKTCIESPKTDNVRDFSFINNECIANCENGYSPNPNDRKTCISNAEYQCMTRTDKPAGGTGFTWNATENRCEANCDADHTLSPTNPEQCIGKGVTPPPSDDDGGIIPPKDDDTQPSDNINAENYNIYTSDNDPITLLCSENIKYIGLTQTRSSSQGNDFETFSVNGTPLKKLRVKTAAIPQPPFNKKIVTFEYYEDEKKLRLEDKSNRIIRGSDYAIIECKYTWQTSPNIFMYSTNPNIPHNSVDKICKRIKNTISKGYKVNCIDKNKDKMNELIEKAKECKERNTNSPNPNVTKWGGIYEKTQPKKTFMCTPYECKSGVKKYTTNILCEASFGKFTREIITCGQKEFDALTKKDIKSGGCQSYEIRK